MAADVEVRVEGAVLGDGHQHRLAVHGHHGELTVGQMFHARPAAGYADLRTPIRGLYQAGSGTHGGGGVTGVPGRNVVKQVLADRKRSTLKRRVGMRG